MTQMSNNNAKICFIVPYFGKFPNYFQLWLYSCAANPNIDWFLVTDNNENYSYPNNVKFISMRFDDLIRKIDTLYDFDIQIKSAYKLTDFKPAYGEIFYELTRTYNYWGHCDVDLIFGNIEKLLKEKLLLGYDKILTRGHFSLYRNTTYINNLYKKNDTYVKIFSDPSYFSFDEWSLGGINSIFSESGAKIYDEILFSDVYDGAFLFYPRQHMVEKGTKENSIFIWNKFGLNRYYQTNHDIQKEEVLYVHLQKRKMSLELTPQLSECFVVVPNYFATIEAGCLSDTLIASMFVRKRIYIEYYLRRLRNLFRKMRDKIDQFGNKVR
jgi:hypothetical protein